MTWRAQGAGGKPRVESDGVFDELVVKTRSGKCWLHVEALYTRRDGSGSYFLALGEYSVWLRVSTAGKVEVTGWEEDDHE